MSLPRFKLDLVGVDDPATLLPLPLAAESSFVPLLQNASFKLDEQMAQDTGLLKQLNEVLLSTDISFVHPVSSDVATTLKPTSSLARSLVQHNPILFQYGISEVDANTAPAATPGRGFMAIAAHNSQPDILTISSTFKEGTVPTSTAAVEKKRARRGARQEVYILNGQEAEAAAAKLASLLEVSMAAASCSGQGSASDEDGLGTDDEERDDPGKQRASYRFSLETLKSLHQEFLTAQSQGYLRLVPTEQLHGVLVALNSSAAAGRNQLLMEDEEAKSRTVLNVVVSLEAMLCELVVLSTPKLPPSLYLEELLSCAVDLTKYHLQYNVLAVHEPRFKRMYRPNAMEEGDDEPVKGGKGPRGKGARAAASGRNLPRWSSLLIGQLEQALSLLSEVVGLVRVGAEGLIPLVRMSQQALTVDSLHTLHYRALGLAVSMFKYYPPQRGTVVDELVQGVLSHLNPGKHVARHYPLQSTESPARIQMVTALVMQLVQVAAELPPVGAKAIMAQACVHPSTRWSDYFWQEVLKRLPSARAAKADNSTDLKAWIEAVVEDLLVALSLPEWPAAAVLLRRLVVAINGDWGMRSADSGVRLLCVDLLGLIARRLCVLAKEADAAEATRIVSTAVEAAMGGAEQEAADCAPSRTELVQQLLLEHLAAASSSGTDAAGHCSASSGGSPVLAATSVRDSARQLVACTMLASQLKELGRGDRGELDERQASETVVQYRQIYDRQRSCLGTSTSGLPLVTRDAAVVLCRWLVADSTLGRGRSTLLKWLAEAGGGGRTRQDAHAAAVRAKAIKLLGGAIEADVRVLSMVEVQDGIKGALGDDSVLVREAAVDLIGKHISRNADLAMQYYDILVRASEDVGVTVRKRAIRLLWECCVRCPDFRNRSDALLRIVSRATDPEETMRTLVTKICAEIWFLPQFQLEDESGVSQISRGPEQRAAQLGEVVMTMYGKMGSAISVPLHSALPVVVTVRSIVGEEDKPEYDAVRKGAKEVADALLARALELQGEQDTPPAEAGLSGRRDRLSPADELFRCLLSLHMLCVADVRLLHRPSDPQRVVRCLSPYIKEVPSAPSDPASRRKAEQLLVVLAILGGCMTALRHLEDALATEIVQDLRAIIVRVSHVQAVSVACQCLCTLANIKTQHRNTVREQASLFYTHLEGDYLKRVTGSADRQRLYPRFLYTIGVLCRFGADILDETFEGSKHPTCASVLDLVLRFYTLIADNIRVRETALQAIGQIFIARPHLAVDVRELQPVLEGALDPLAPASLKVRCLMSLTELLRVEEETLLGRQAAARQEAAEAQQASTLPEAESRALARRNGEGDTGSVSSGLIQMLWDHILALAIDTTPSASPGGGGQTPPATPSGTSSAHGAVVRRRALDLIEAVIRGGIVVPWSAMPVLCALATDPERETASRALGCLRSIVAANTAFVAGQVPAGVGLAYAFHRRLATVDRPGQVLEPEKCRPLLEGLSYVWQVVFQPDRLLKSKFLTALLKPLDDGCCLASGSAAKADPNLLNFLSYIIAELPYRKMDELLAVLTRLNEILSRRAEAVLGRFQEIRQAVGRGVKDKEATDAAAGSASGAVAAASPLPTRGSGAAATGLVATVKASLALSLMLLLKQYLRLSYELTTERIAKYDPLGPQRKVEERLNAVHSGKLQFKASVLRFDAAARAVHLTAPPAGVAYGAASEGSLSSSSAAAGTVAASDIAAARDPSIDEVYQVLKKLMKQDEADYRQAATAAMVDAEAEGGPGAHGDAAGEAIDLEELMAAPDAAGTSKKPPTGSRGRGRGSRGRGSRGGGSGAGCDGGGRGRGRSAAGSTTGSIRGRPSTGAKRGRKRKAPDSDSEGEGGGETGSDGEGAGDDDDDMVHYRPRATKRRLDKTL